MAKIVGYTFLFVGFFTLIGTAGAADRDLTMPLTEIGARISLSMGVLAAGIYTLFRSQDQSNL